MVKLSANGPQLLTHRFKTDRAKFAVSREVENANNAILNQGASCHFQSRPFDKRQCLRVKNVRLIEQCDPDIHIQQIAHALNAFLIHQRTHVLRSDDLRARRQQCIFAIELWSGKVRDVLHTNSITRQT